MAQVKNKRMFSMSVIDTDSFLEMPISSRLLYYDLGMRADDDGFVDNYKKILLFTGLKEDDLKVLIAKKYIIPFQSGVLVIRHWKLNNYLRSDRYEETTHSNEKALLEVENREYKVKNETNKNVGIPMVDQMATGGIPSKDKNSIEKNKKEEINKEEKFDEKENYEEMFDEFWSRYPKKKTKAKAKEWYMKHRPSSKLHNDILLAITFFKDEEDWKIENGKYIPYPITFLNQRRWEDVIND